MVSIMLVNVNINQIVCELIQFYFIGNSVQEIEFKIDLASQLLLVMSCVL